MARQRVRRQVAEERRGRDAVREERAGVGSRAVPGDVERLAEQLAVCLVENGDELRVGLVRPERERLAAEQGKQIVPVQIEVDMRLTRR